MSDWLLYAVPGVVLLALWLGFYAGWIGHAAISRKWRDRRHE